MIISKLRFAHFKNAAAIQRNYSLTFTNAVFFFVLSLLFSSASAQATDPSILTNRLCKTWKIEKVIQDNKTSAPDNVLTDFVLIIRADHVVQQGMSPDGLIKGTWTLDEKNRIFTVKDDQTSAAYPMKIISISTDELVLQDQSNPSLTIYYKAK